MRALRHFPRAFPAGPPLQECTNDPSELETMNQVITTEALRTPGERRALLIAAGSFICLFLLLSIGTLGIVLAGMGATLLLGIVRVTFEQSRRRRQSVMVTARQLPRLHALVLGAAERLTYDVPSVYVEQSPVLNAYALGLFGTDTLVVSSGLIDCLSDAELSFVLGHEMTHVKCGHTFWRILGGEHPVLRMPALSRIGSLFLKWWGRKAELTADRGGLIACADHGAALRALLTLAVGSRLAAEIDVDQVVRQSVAADSNPLSTVVGLDSSHPDVGSRIRELLAFAQTDACRRVVPAPAPA